MKHNHKTITNIKSGTLGCVKQGFCLSFLPFDCLDLLCVDGLLLG